MAPCMIERSFFEDDSKVAEGVRMRLTGINLHVVDVGKIPNSVKLQTYTATCITRGYVVIYAWCYSLYAMKEFDMFAPAKLCEVYTKSTESKTIHEIVKESFVGGSWNVNI